MENIPPNPLIDLVVIQSTPFCNLDCRYCYLPSRNLKSRMSAETINNVFRNIFTSGWIGNSLTVVWHAGEPLVLPPEYYRLAFELINEVKPKDLNLIHSFQTNGTIVSPEIVALIKEFDVKVGISIDGPKHIHDKYRVDRSGKGTFERVVSGARYLRDANIELSAICVLTDYALDYPDEIFDFLVGEGFCRLAFNIEEVEGVNLSSTLQRQDVYDRYWKFMSRIWNLAINSEKSVFLRELDDSLTGILRPEGTQVRNSLTEPFAILNVDVEGNFSTFSPELLGFNHQKYGNFCFGNLAEVNLIDAVRNETFLNLNADIQKGVSNCAKECEYFSICGGGAPANKLWENGELTSTETVFCLLTRQLPTDLSLQMLNSIGSKSAMNRANRCISDNAYPARPFS